jgi:cytochrome oxidase Cu insertion factor (SCO1/SenC/PrrC family)
MKERRWNYGIVAVAIIGSILLSSCAQQAPLAPAPVPIPSPTPTAVSTWMNIELTDVATGQTFKLSDFKGKPVLLESFAVWCPTCLRQQKEMQKLLAGEGDAIIHVSLDTDPNEDEAKVKEHLERNGLDWYFAISPIELTEALIDDFGLSIVSAPSAPVVLICEDQSTRFLKDGVKSADTLLSEVEKGCK